MPFRQLTHFLTVAECSSINQAAQKLDISQQSLRASLNSLENKLGFTLFLRSSSGVELSPEGKAILEDVRGIVNTVTRWNAFTKKGEEVRGTVRIAATISAINFILLDFIKKIQKHHPFITVELYTLREQKLLPLLSKKSMIGVLGSFSPAMVESFRKEVSSYEMRLMDTQVEDPYRIFINQNHPLASQDRLFLKDLKQFTVATYPQDNEQIFPYKAIYSYFSSDKAFFYASSQDTILRVVSDDPSMAAVFPRSTITSWKRKFAEQPAASALCCLPIEDFPMPGQICMICPEEQKLSLSEKYVVEELKEVFLACQR